MINIKFLQYFSLLRYKVVSKLLNDKKFTLILDMEDSAQNLFSKKKTIELKKRCRDGIIYLSKNCINLEKCFLRINSIKSDHFNNDIKILKKAKKDKLKLRGIFLPKTENFTEIKHVYEKLNIPIIPIIETKKGYQNLEKILIKDKNFNYIYGIHYGHFDFCLDKKIWPLPEPYHKDYWKIINPIIDLCNNYKKKFIQTPYPLINNNKILWSMIKILKKQLLDDGYVTLVNINKSFFKKPNKIKYLSLRKISSDKNYLINFAKKIIKEYEENRQQNKSFSLTKKRFIAPHQFLMAKKFLNKNEKKFRK